jgi:hypothetical protein
MDTSLLDFRTQCLEATLDLLWRQWCSLGVAGHAQAAQPSRLIDPEALILATTAIGRHEPRMFDEALDWLGRYGSLINLQRLKNLHKLDQLGQAKVLSSIASWLVDRDLLTNWKMFIRTPSSKPDQIEPLFLGVKGPASTTSDPHFLANGLERSVFQPRRMSRAPHPTTPPNLIIALRALIGVSARVEIILYLAGGSAAHASETARATGYTARTLQRLLQEMSISGHLLSQEPPTQSNGKIRRGSNRRYHLQPADWAFLTDGQPLPQWTPWAALFSFMQSLFTIIPDKDARPKHPAVISSQLRESLAKHGQALATAGLLPLLDLRPEAPGDELLKTLATRLPQAIAQL